jgi:hypothetical protein
LFSVFSSLSLSLYNFCIRVFFRQSLRLITFYLLSSTLINKVVVVVTVMVAVLAVAEAVAVAVAAAARKLIR